MNIDHFHIHGPLLFTPKIIRDDRGIFMETFRAHIFENTAGQSFKFVQDNQSVSKQAGTIRGLHYQVPPHQQGKLVSCLSGRIIDIAVDIRQNSPTYGQHIRVELSPQTAQLLWIPPGFLHGFATLDAYTQVTYKCTDYYAKESERTILWNDPILGLDWGLDNDTAILSDKDKDGESFSDFISPFNAEYE